MIKAIPAKALNWAGFNEFMLSKQIEAATAKRHLTYEGEYRELMAGGMRQQREAAYRLAVNYVHSASIRISHHAPSEESIAWGETYGTTNVWTCAEAEEAATAEVAGFLAQFAK